MNLDSETLRSKITCAICSKYYATPKTLPCLHSFCLACLEAISTDKTGMLQLTCPSCQKEFSEVDKALVDLPNAFQINRHLEYHKFKQRVLGQVNVLCEKCVSNKVTATAFCTKCNKFICELCLKIHNSWSELQDHTTLKLYELKNSYQKYIPVTNTIHNCDVHNKECNAFCESCHELVCHECILKTHRDHQCFYSDESAKSHKKALIEELDQINHLPTQLHTAITVIDNIVENYSNQGQEVENNLFDTLNSLEKAIATQRETLTKALKDHLSDKGKLLSDQKQDLEHTMMKINSCIGFITETINEKYPTEFFILEKGMKDRINELQDEFSKMELQPVEEPEIHFKFDPETLLTLQESIKISDGSILHGISKVYTTGEVISFYISLSSAFYKTKNNPMEELSAEIQSLRNGSSCPATVAVSSNGFAKLQCTFSERGWYSVNVKISGRHINNSPYRFYVKPNGNQLQQPIKSITKLQGPKSLAITKNHQIVICEESHHSVSVYSWKNGKKVATIGEYGKDKGLLSHPTGVAIDSDGFLYVADTKNDRIQKFDGSGKFVAMQKGEKESNTKLHLPSSVTIGPDGLLYVADRGNSRIVVLDKDLEYIRSFGSAGYGLGSLHDPWDTAFDDQGFIYITDRRQHCIQVFTKTGSFRGKIGSQGQQKGKLNHPTGIAIDRFGKIYVCESGNHRVSIFRTSSEFLECFSIGLSMVNPCGVAVDEDGFLYVASDETVHVF